MGGLTIASMDNFFGVFFIFALIGTLDADDKAEIKKKNDIAGVYAGLVEDELARLIIKSDGSLTIFPSKDSEIVLRGKWKLEKGLVVAKLLNPEGEQITAILRQTGKDMVVFKSIRPDGSINEFGPPHFKKKKAFGGKGPSGLYEGVFDDESLLVELTHKGNVLVRSAEDPNGDDIYTGKWKLDGKHLLLNVTTVCCDEATVKVRITNTGFMIIEVDSLDGKQTYSEALLKRQDSANKKNIRKKDTK